MGERLSPFLVANLFIDPLELVASLGPYHSGHRATPALPPASLPTLPTPPPLDPSGRTLCVKASALTLHNPPCSSASGLPPPQRAACHPPSSPLPPSHPYLAHPPPCTYLHIQASAVILQNMQQHLGPAAEDIKPPQQDSFALPPLATFLCICMRVGICCDTAEHITTNTWDQQLRALCCESKAALQHSPPPPPPLNICV